MQELYERVPVRDGLAGERTVLAAERTFLAYVRTAFGMIVAGLTGAHFLENDALIGAAHGVTVIGGLTFLVGAVRAVRSRAVTRRMLERLAGPGQPQGPA